MRRKDREMDETFAYEVIDQGIWAVMSLAYENEAYGIPISYARDGKVLYMHGAKEGKKMDMIGKNPRGSMIVVGRVHVPDFIQTRDLETMKKEGKLNGAFLSRVFTTEYESAIAIGHFRIVEDREEKRKALRLLSEKYLPDKMPYFPMAAEDALDIVGILAFDIEKVYGKRKKYDDRGEEMKYGRMK